MTHVRHPSMDLGKAILDLHVDKQTNLNKMSTTYLPCALVLDQPGQFSTYNSFLISVTCKCRLQLHFHVLCDLHHIRTVVEYV